MKYSLASVLAFTFALTVVSAASVFAENPPPVALPPMATLPAVPDASSKDQVVESMNHAIDAYRAGKYKEALKLTDQAQGGICTKHVALYRALLPPVPAGGWVAEDKNDASATLGAQLVGGMSVVGRDYKGGGHTITISYVIDSPMMAMLSGIMQAVTATSGPNGSSEEIKGNKATYSEQPENRKGASHQLMVYAGDMMVLIQSSTLPKETIMQFANIIDYDRLKAVQ